MALQATWEKINNQVAWRMADTIAARQRELAQLAPARHAPLFAGASKLSPVYEWVGVNEAAREVIASRIVDARLAGGLGVVVTFWLFTGLYLAFTELALFVKSRLQRVAALGTRA